MGRIRPGSQRRLLRPFEEWPQADQALWRSALREANPFGHHSAASSWGEHTRSNTKLGYARWLGWLSEHSIDLGQPPADRVTLRQVAAYVADLWQVNGDFTILCRLQALYNTMRIMAPDRDWVWLQRAHSAVKARSVPVRDKATRIQPSGELVKLGKGLMRDAEQAVTKPPLARAVLFRDGLMIAFEALRPLRLSNLATIALGRQLIRHASGYHLYFSGREVKRGQPIEANVPDLLLDGFARYLDHYRPILLTRGGVQSRRECDALWISKNGTPLKRKAIQSRVKKHTAAAFGKPLWVHLFRDSAATTIATQDPKHVRSVKNILSHSKLATSERHYNQARSLEASRRYQRIIADLVGKFDAAEPAPKRKAS